MRTAVTAALALALLLPAAGAVAQETDTDVPQPSVGVFMGGHSCGGSIPFSRSGTARPDKDHDGRDGTHDIAGYIKR